MTKKTVACGFVLVGFVVAGFVSTALAAGKASDTGDERNLAVVKNAAGATTQPAQAGKPTSQPANESKAKSVMDALREASDAKKHLYVFIQEKDDEQTRAGRKTFDAAVSKLGGIIQWIAINRKSPSESEFVKEYGLNAAPMPLAIVFAPNKAILGGFLGARLTEPQLLDALASPGMQACLKALQDRKFVFVCLQNATTKLNDVAMKGVNDFKADAKFSKDTEIVKIDPSDTAEKKFLTQLKVDPKVDQATTLFLAPPGSIVGKFSGATDKDKLATALKAASSGGCSGTTGCCPKK